MEGILRFNGASKHDPQIEEWMQRQRGEFRSLARTWFEVMRTAGKDVLELFHDAQPTACVGDVPFGYVNVFTKHLIIGFFNGSLLSDPKKLLQGTGKRMRHVKLIPGREFDSDALTELIRASYLEAREHSQNF